MLRSLTYLHKLYIISFFLYGLPFSLLMWAVNHDTTTFYNFLFYLIFYGGLMSFSMISLEKRSLKKEGVDVLDKVTMDPEQERTVSTAFTKEEFYEFWKNAKAYKISQKNDGSLDVYKRLHTLEFKEVINISYQEQPSPSMILKSKPRKWLSNNLALIHRTINTIKNYIESNA